MSRKRVSTAHTTWLDIQEIKVGASSPKVSRCELGGGNVFKCVWPSACWLGKVNEASTSGTPAKTSLAGFSFVLWHKRTLHLWLHWIRYRQQSSLSHGQNHLRALHEKLPLLHQSDFLRRAFKIFGQIGLSIRPNQSHGLPNGVVWKKVWRSFVWETVIIKKAAISPTSCFHLVWQRRLAAFY